MTTMLRARSLALALALSLPLAVSALACGKTGAKQSAPPDASSGAAPSARTPAPAATREPSPSSAPSASASAPSRAAVPPIADAGASACRLIYGPAQQAFRGPAALHADESGVDIVFNDDGAPRISRVAAGPIDAAAKPVATRAASTPTPATPVACTFAGAFVYCVAKGGDLLRSPIVGGAAQTVGAARAGTRVDGASLGAAHTVVAYLASRKLAGEWVSEAWAALDASPPIRISEDGSGATAVDLAPRGGSVVAMMVDARSALTAVHARVLSVENGHLTAGKDAVVFVGGPPERRTAGTLATPHDTGAAAFALVPIAKDASVFGVAAIRVAEPPEVDAPVVWSMYPNGLDPAPIAATQGHTPMRVARIRPLGPEPTSPKVLEIARLEPNGELVSQGILPTHGTTSDLAVEQDARGALWLAYTDADGTWLERRQCP